ncbi:DUF5753 domain-containing protein [Streptomyces laculatispora]|uniref:DUF5753 domain-containing protein n=1 Tax=Streptomyces laculatispora TaxID=887464 RepID=UPI0035186D98
MRILRSVPPPGTETGPDIPRSTGFPVNWIDPSLSTRLPTFHFVLDESVLIRPIGGRNVHREQLQKLLHIGGLRTVQLQLMPLDRTEQPSLDGPFTLVTPKGRQQVAYLEIHTHPRLITGLEEVRVLAARYGTIQSAALTPRESLAAIEKMLGER